MSEALIAYLSGVCNFARGVAGAVIIFTPIAFMIAYINDAPDRVKSVLFVLLFLAVLIVIFVPTEELWKLL